MQGKNADLREIWRFDPMVIGTITAVGSPPGWSWWR